MEFVENALGISVPVSAVSRRTPPDNFRQMPWAREFVPGTQRHLNDPKVGDLNKDLKSLNCGVQKLFAVWAGPDQRCPMDGAFGVSIWVTEDDGQTAQHIGNPAYEMTRDGFMGIPDKPKIFQWLSDVNFLSEENRNGLKGLMRRFEENNEKARAANQEKVDEERALATEKYVAKVTEKVPSRSDRTIDWKQKPAKKG